MSSSLDLSDNFERLQKSRSFDVPNPRAQEIVESERPKHSRVFVGRETVGRPSEGKAVAVTSNEPVRRRRFVGLEDVKMDGGGTVPYNGISSAPDAPVRRRKFIQPQEARLSTMGIEVSAQADAPVRKRSFLRPPPAMAEQQDAKGSVAAIHKRVFAEPGRYTAPTEGGMTVPLDDGKPKRRRDFMGPVRTHGSDCPPADSTPPGVGISAVQMPPSVDTAAGGDATAPLPDSVVPERKRRFLLPSVQEKAAVESDASRVPVPVVDISPPSEDVPRAFKDIEGSPESGPDLPLQVAIDDIINDSRPFDAKVFYYSPPPEARRLMVRNICQRHNGRIHPLEGYHTAPLPSDMDLDSLNYPSNFRPPLLCSFTEQQLENVHWKVKNADFRMSKYEDKLEFVKGARMTQLEWELSNVNIFSDIGKELQELHDMLLPWVR